MSAESTLRRGRRAVEALFTDTCKITKAGAGDPVLNETTLKYSVVARVVVYQGRCRVSIKSDINSNIVEATAGGREATYQTSLLQLPIVGSEAVRPNYVAEILTCPWNPALVGAVFNLQGDISRKSHSTKREWRLKETTS